MNIDFNKLYAGAEEEIKEREKKSRDGLKKIREQEEKRQENINSLLSKVGESIERDTEVERKREVEEAKAKAEREVKEALDKKYNTHNQDVYKGMIKNLFKNE